MWLSFLFLFLLLLFSVLVISVFICLSFPLVSLPGDDILCRLLFLSVSSSVCFLCVFSSPTVFTVWFGDLVPSIL